MRAYRRAVGAMAGVLAGAVILSGAGVSGAAGEECTPNARRITVHVMDTTDAAVVNAAVRIDGSDAYRLGADSQLRSDAQGRATSACLRAGDHTATITAGGFESMTLHIVIGPDPRAETRAVTAHLRPLTIETAVDAVDSSGVSSEDLAGSKTLHEADLRQLADDPDELARQLQVLAAVAGGAPGQATISVDGFQNGGRIPPKSAIAFIRINPDLFAAEYERPPYQGGRVEIFTKPGQASFHGALFTTQSAGGMNARDPFAANGAASGAAGQIGSRAAIGKQRYGFELSGPIKSKRSDFAIALEHRQIDQIAVVNAVTLDRSGATTSTIATVPTPQTLWQASARLGVMLTPKNNFTATYTANVNSLRNVGVGGTSLEEAGFESVQSEHALRFTNLQTISARALHETRVGYTWRYRDDTSHSAAPSLQVAGAFTGGGAVTQALRSHERDLEIDDDVLYTRGKHTAKVGVELLNIAYGNAMPTNFNGSYLFGGGSAPSLTDVGMITISGLEQYRRALLGLPGGSPTTFRVTSGTAAVSLNQLRVVLYAQDQWKLRPRLQLSLGLRWSMQSAPETIGNVGPRLGVAWSPDRAQKWVFHLRTGLFTSPIDAQTALETHRLDGRTQRERLVYGAAYGQPSAGPSSTQGSAVITTLRAPLGSLNQTPSLQSHVGVEHDFPLHWHAQANLYLVRAWDVLRSRNINAPLDDSPTGARPFAQNVNLNQFQQTGTAHGNVMFVGVDQHSLRRVQIFAGYIRMDLRGDGDEDTLFPQSSLTDVGEVARPSWQTTHHGIVFSTLTLPLKVALTTQFDAASGMPYNVTTGFDNNGDGVLNDRPQRANEADTIVYPTRFGLLSPVGTGAALARNAGTLPWSVHLDLNLSRSFAMTHPQQGEPKTIALNLRSSNALNHSNVTSVGGVLGSPLFGQAYAGSAGRRVEVGLRYSF